MFNLRVYIRSSLKKKKNISYRPVTHDNIKEGPIAKVSQKYDITNKKLE